MTTTSTDPRIKVERLDPSDPKLAELKVKYWPVWSKEPSEFDWHYDQREICYILEGDVTVRTDQGTVRLGKGDLVTFEKGLSCNWHVKKAVRKHYKFE